MFWCLRFWCLSFCFLGSFPEEVLWKLDSLRGTSHWKAAQGKLSDWRDVHAEANYILLPFWKKVPFSHTARSPQLTGCLEVPG